MYDVDGPDPNKRRTAGDSDPPSFVDASARLRQDPRPSTDYRQMAGAAARQACEPGLVSLRHATVRLDQLPHAVVIRLIGADALWELTVPDVEVRRGSVRLTLAEVAEHRGAEASTLLGWDDYTRVRDWLRCVPDGHPAMEDIEPSLCMVRTAFGRMFDSLLA